MARLGSKSKLGYYPTPPEEVARIKGALHLDAGVRVLDPCCGTGEALAQLAQNLPVQTYGIELEQNRVTEAAERLDEVVWGDALSEVQCSSGFDVIFLNPPYDFEDASLEEKAKRLEFRFLRRCRSILAPKGLMVMVFPLSALRSDELRDDIARLANIEVFAFSGDLYERFSQLVIFGWKRAVPPGQREKQFAYLERIAKMPKEQVQELVGTTQRLSSKGYRVAVCHSTDLPLKFESRRLDPDRALPMIQRLDIYGKQVRVFLAAPEIQLSRPLMPMRQGHLGMQIVSGQCNGAVIVDKNGDELVLKGYVKRDCTETEEVQDDETLVERRLHAPKCGFRVLNVNQAVITTIVQGEESERQEEDDAVTV